jgi:HupE / UreJ protein
MRAFTGPLFALGALSLRCILFAACCMLGSAAANAHSAGTSYLHIDVNSSAASLTASWDIAIAELQWTLDLDVDGDASVSPAELVTRRTAIERLALKNLHIARGDQACSLRVSSISSTTHGSQPYAALRLNALCKRSGPLRVSSELYFGSAAYTVLLDVASPQGRFTTSLSPSASLWLEPAAPSIWQTLGHFIWQGIWHVLTGYDHIAFLLLLLLPSVLCRPKKPGTIARIAMRDVVGIVTAFTISHSITLSLAATGTLRLPAQPIEVAIAASIVIAGVLNLIPGAARWRLLLAFGFGFVHGFGFANALQEINQGGSALVPLLAGFNLGVECAQLLIVGVTLPLLLLLNRSPLYARKIMPATSLAIAMVGAAWVVARI